VILWDYALEGHDIRIAGVKKAHLNKYLGGTKLPNQNVMVDQAELVVTNYIDNLLVGTGYHVVIHIFTFPKKTQETVPLDYTLFLGLIGTEPPVFDWQTNWWDR